MYSFTYDDNEGTWNFVSVFPEPSYDRNDADGDGFLMIGNNYAFKPDGVNFKILNGEVQVNYGDVKIVDINRVIGPYPVQVNHS